MRPLTPVFALAMLAACTSGNAQEKIAASGQKGSRTFDASGFQKVSLSGSDNVIVKVGGRESVTAAGDTAVLDRLEIEVKNGTLKVGRKRNSGWVIFGDGSRGNATITVTLPVLTGAAVAGSGDMQVDHAVADSFDGSIAGSGNLRVAKLEAQAASFDIAGSGDVSAAGQARSIEVSIAGSGSVEAPSLRSEQAKISIAGSGGVNAMVDGQAKVSIMGSGDVVLGGKAVCTVSKMGSGTVRCAG